MKMIKWPSIEQYRNVVKNITHRARYRGTDADGNAIYEPFAKLPTLKFEGTVKLHGTNAAIARKVLEPQEMWCQSRENIITPEKDNAGFAMFVKGHEDEFRDLIATAIGIHDRSHEFPYILVFGEWCGKGIQGGVAISDLPKMFVIFGIALADEEGNKHYFTRQEVTDVVDGGREYVLRATGTVPTETGIYCIWDFPTYGCEIDFDAPHEKQNFLNDRTAEVEAECPVGKAFGVTGVGEGIVWRCIEPGWEDSGYWFKVKGEAHSKSKVKTLATVDVERINNINELAEKLANDGRLEQMCQQVFDTLNGGEPDIKRTGEFIKAVMQDIFKEEMDTVAASGFTGKELNGPVSKRARDFLMTKLEV